MIQIIEEYLVSKQGKDDGGEDRLIKGKNFIGICDGATDKSGLNWGTEDQPKRGGSVLADIVKETLEDDLTSTNPDWIIQILNEKIQKSAQKANIDLTHINNRADVGFAVYVPKLNCIFSIHDCIFGYKTKKGKEHIEYNDKVVDKVTSTLRSEVIKLLKQEGIEPLKDGRDLGREFIMPLLKRQAELQNIILSNDEEWVFGLSKGSMTYETMNGFAKYLNVTKLPNDVDEIVIASDGFSKVFFSLEKTLKLHKELLVKDPYCINELMSTKGLAKGNVSFDDMAYIRFKV